MNRGRLERTPTLLLEPFLPHPLLMLRKAKRGGGGPRRGGGANIPLELFISRLAEPKKVTNNNKGPCLLSTSF